MRNEGGRTRTVRVAVVGGLGSLFLGLVCGNLRADVAPVGGEFQVNTYTTSNQSSPQVSADGSGRFVVVWQSGSYFESGADGSSEGVSARRYDASGVPQGAEFVANSFTFESQTAPAVAVAPSGDFVVAWSGGNYDFEQDGSESGVFLQDFTAAGTPRGGEQLANTVTAGAQTTPAVATLPAGDFVVVWTSYPSYYSHAGGDGDGAGVFGQRYDSAGAQVGGEFQVNTYTTGQQGRARVAGDGLGGFVVVWNSGSAYGGSQDGSGSGIFGRHFDASGAPSGGEFQVNTYTTGDQSLPAIAADPRGGFVVTWQSAADYSTPPDVFGQRFDVSAARVGGEFEVNSYTTGSQGAPAVAVDGGGNFLVVWQSFSDPGREDGDDVGVFGQHFASTGEPLGNEFQVNTYTTGEQFSPSVAASPDGSFVVVWQSGYAGSGPVQDEEQGGIFGQRLRTTTLEATRRLRGDRLVITDDPTDPRKRRLRLHSRDAAIQPDTAAGDDPTTGGATLRLTSATFDVTYLLPAGNWRRRGVPGAPSYEYRDRALLSGPITEVEVRSGALRVSGEGAQLGHVLTAANPDPVKVIFRPGTTGLRHCMVFGGAATFTPGKRFRAQNAPAPASCR
jgi:hypothetical protein